MPLPQQVIEQLSREPAKTPGWSWQLLMFAATIFFASLVVYFGIAFGYKPYLSSRTEALKKQIQTFGQQVPLEEQAKIINFYSQIVNLKSILADHVYGSPVFDWLEKNTQVNVYYDKFGLNIQTGQLVLGGFGKSVDDVIQQVAIYENRPEIKRTNLRNLSFVNGLWQFDATLYFEPGFFRHSVK